METSNKNDKIKILLFGFININVMDGSAVFLSGVTAMLAQSNNLEIDLVLANPVHRDLLLKSIINLPNVNIISPYKDVHFTEQKLEWLNKGQMSHYEAGEVINHYWNKNDYDWLFIRGMEVVEQLLYINPSILLKSLTYVTGITHEGQELSEHKQQTIEQIFSKSAYLLCQTQEMKDFLVVKFKDILAPEKIIDLNPMIPDTTSDFNEVFVKKDQYNKLCYTGKFDINWNSIPIVISFKELQEKVPDMVLEVAGDKFSYSPDYPDFKKEMSYLLNKTYNLNWYGAVSRNRARDLIIQSDIGITWRHKDMDSSLELSTKLLEYGSLGKAVVLNPTPMHIRIFGEDYPLYADTQEDFIRVVYDAATNPEVYEKAARRMFEVSQNFTYTQTLNKLLPVMLKNRLEESFASEGIESSDQLIHMVIHNKDSKVQELPLKNRNEQKSYLMKFVESLPQLLEFFDFACEIGTINKYAKFGNSLILFIDKNDKGKTYNLESLMRSPMYIELVENLSFTALIRKLTSGELDKHLGNITIDDFVDENVISTNETLRAEVKELRKTINRMKRDISRVKRKFNRFKDSVLGKKIKAPVKKVISVFK